MCHVPCVMYVAFPRSEYYEVVRLPLYLRHFLTFSVCSCLPPWMPFILSTASGWTSNHHGSGCLCAHSRNVPFTQGVQRFSQVPTCSFRCRATVYDPGGVQQTSPLRTDACCLPAKLYCRPPRRRQFRGLQHSLALRPGSSRPPASSDLLPPLMRFR